MVSIRLENLTKTFQTPSGSVNAVDNQSLEIRHGEFFSFVGPSGCGKTTTLRMIAGLESPSSGKIFFDSNEVTNTSPQERNIAMVFQDVALPPHMSVRRNIGYPLEVRGQKDDYSEKIEQVAKMLEIEELLDKKPGQLSGGQQQRVALGRAIIRDPNVILMDEPMSDLDAKLKAMLRVEIQRLHKEIDSTFVYVTHDQEEAMTMSDRIALMRGGVFEQIDKPEVLFHEPKNKFSAEFIGQPQMNILNIDNSEKSISISGHDIDVDVYSEFKTAIKKSKKVDRLDIGFRPRHIKITKDIDHSILSANIDVIEPLGTEYAIYLRTQAGDEIIAVTGNAESITEGEELGIAELSTAYLFDGTSGETLSKFRFVNDG